MPKHLNEQTLHALISERVENNAPFGLLLALTRWLRHGKAKHAAERVRLLRRTLEADAELCGKTAVLLSRWLCHLRLYPLFISAGIFSREGFARELMGRWYEKFNPAYKDLSDLRDIFSQLFKEERDVEWLEAVPMREWLVLLNLLRRHTPEQNRETARRYMRQEGLYAVEMLAIWVAAEELEPDLIRLDPKLLDRDSPFVALEREVARWVEARFADAPFDDSHLYVMLDQCRRQVENLRKKGTLAGAGSSLGVAHLLERLDQTLGRMTMLMDVFSPVAIAPRRVLALTGTLARAAAEQHSLSWLWKRSVKMLARSITQNSSDHGEHYITRNTAEYRSMFYSAAGGGVVIALMSLFKIHLGMVIQNQFWLSLAEGLNYGIGFALIYMLGFTVATKQPAMTASRFAAAVERNDKGHAVDMKLAQLLVDVLRSQTAAAFGNVFAAISLAAVIAGVYWLTNLSPLLDPSQVAYQVHAVDPMAGTLWFAAIAGVWLFCSGIISGFFDNRCDYLNLRMRLRHHPLLSPLPEKTRARFADYVHNHYGSIMGNLCFGMLLGMTGFVGHVTGLPLDIRHVAFSSANIGYASVSGMAGLGEFLKNLIFVLLIGGVNLWVSFSITLWVALRSRETRIDSWWRIFRCVWQIAKERPWSLFFPWQLPQDAIAAAVKENKDGKESKESDHTPH
ncbi:recombinase [Conchiformibius steedae DSM 2580]|uniref:Recombinase n=1 Tax=Conchiformibius steedae DSM 2580 TaxID=1121352 RepID=A0AAE9HYW3_9NEIS|nr:recombinase [Conchiformibius steedae]QMT33819.1 recombinase [Conchiformibius steedae]URD68480.1 recombinase [Conchiformibius steedae DSM 2580]